VCGVCGRRLHERDVLVRKGGEGESRCKMNAWAHTIQSEKFVVPNRSRSLFSRLTVLVSHLLPGHGEFYMKDTETWANKLVL
jgi:hypothetical protein